MFGLVSMWYAGPGKHPTAVRTSWFSFRRYECGLPRTSYNFKQWVAGLLLLSTASVLFSFRRLKLCANILSITVGRSTSTTFACTDLGYGLLERLTNTWHDPKFGISVPPYAVNFIVGFCRLLTLGLSLLYRDLGMMLVSAPESIFHKARVCFPSGLSTRQTSKRAFSSQETTWTPLVKGVALIGP